MAPPADHDGQRARSISIERLEAFVAIVRYGSFAGAADALGVTTSVIVMRMTALEKALLPVREPTKARAGDDEAKSEARKLAELLERDEQGRRTSTPTRYGEGVLKYAKSLLELADQIEAIDPRRPQAGKLRLGLAETIAQTWLSPFLHRLSEELPSLDLDVEIDTSPQLGQRLLRRELDLAFLLSPPSEVQSQYLCSYEMGFFAHPKSLPSGRTLGLQELGTHRLLTFSKGTQPYHDLCRLFDQPERPRPRLIACTTIGVVTQLAVEGVGIAVVPHAVVVDQLAVLPHAVFGEIRAYVEVRAERSERRITGLGDTEQRTGARIALAEALELRCELGRQHDQIGLYVAGGQARGGASQLAFAAGPSDVAASGMHAALPR